MTIRFTKSIGAIALWTVVLGLSIFIGAENPNAVILAQSTSEYDVTAIIPPGGHIRSKALGINNLGQVVGHFSNADGVSNNDINRQAFIWDAVSGAQFLSTLSGESSAWGVNDDGLASGLSFDEGGHVRAVRWNSSDNYILDIGTFVNSSTGQEGHASRSFDINNLGQVTGYADIPNDAGDFSPFHAFLFDDSSGIQDLGTFDDTWPQYQYGYSISYDVNNNGKVVGVANDSSWAYLPFIYYSGGMHALTMGTQQGEWHAVAINDSDLIGGHVVASTNQCYPYYWPNPSAAPVAVNMPTAFPYGEIYGMNASGEMVGVMWNDAGLEHAFIFDTTNGLEDLNDLIPTGTGWVLNYARDINDAGEIVGFGELSGEIRGFVLTAASEPETGQIAGTVTDTDTGSALPGVDVRVFDDTGSLVVQEQTDSSGSYTTAPLYVGTYFVATFNTDGYEDELFNNIACNGCNPTTGTPVNVTGQLDRQLPISPC